MDIDTGITISACGRGSDHGRHRWSSKPKTICPGFGAMREERPAPEWVDEISVDECGAMHQGYTCSQGKGHNGDHNDFKGLFQWPAHNSAVVPGDDLTHLGRLVVAVSTDRTYTTEIRGVKIAACDTFGMTEEEQRLHKQIAALTRSVVDLEEDRNKPYGEPGPKEEPLKRYATCFRTDAHGEHLWNAEYEEGFETVTCEGIRAHPNTMIGGAKDREPAAHGQIDVGPLTGGEGHKDFRAGGVRFEQCDNSDGHEEHRLPKGGNTWCKGVVL